MTNKVKSVEANSPKISDQARPEKIGSMIIGTAPSIAARGGQQDRPQTNHAALHDGIEQRASSGQRQVDEVHEYDRVAGHDARQGNHADHPRGREIDRIEIAADMVGALKTLSNQKPGITPRIVSGIASITTSGMTNDPICATSKI